METLAGAALIARARMRRAEPGPEPSGDEACGAPTAFGGRPRLVLHEADALLVCDLPAVAVGRGRRFLRISGTSTHPPLEFGPVDVAVMRRLVVELDGPGALRVA